MPDRDSFHTLIIHYPYLGLGEDWERVYLNLEDEFKSLPLCLYI